MHLLVGHDYGQPLARKLDGASAFADSDDALTFEAAIAPSSRMRRISATPGRPSQLG